MTDASLLAAGAVLMQADENSDLHPCTYFSRTFSSAQHNYDIYDRKLLAVILALEEWHQYLQGTAHPVTIITDHKTFPMSKTLEHYPDGRPDGPFSSRTSTCNGKSLQERKWPLQMCYPDVTMWTPPRTIRRHPYVQNPSSSKHWTLP